MHMPVHLCIRFRFSVFQAHLCSVITDDILGDGGDATEHNPLNRRGFDSFVEQRSWTGRKSFRYLFQDVVNANTACELNRPHRRSLPLTQRTDRCTTATFEENMIQRRMGAHTRVAVLARLRFSLQPDRMDDVASDPRCSNA